MINREDLMIDFIKSGKVTSVTYDSKAVEEGSLFVCKGVHFKETYLEEAVKRGAIAYVSEKEYAVGAGIKAFIVDDIREAMKTIAEAFYGPVYEKLNVTGITGTKGKSTTTYFMVGIIDDYMKATGGNRSAVLSTINNYDGVIDEESHLTTPEIMELYKHFSNAVNHGIKYMTMEVSSQALKVGRVSGVTFDVGCFINISPDHISPIEHPDFEDYFESKLKLFEQCKIACINCDCDEQDRIKAASKKAEEVVTFSQQDENADIFAYNIKTIDGRVHFDVRGRNLEKIGAADFDEHIELAAFGKLNVENALAAISISVCYGIPFEYIKSGLGRVIVPGRMELFASKDGKAIALVDYAHNMLSFNKLIETVKHEFPDKNYVAVFGSTGGKALNRREELGSVAGKNCQKTYITEEDSYDEDPMSICEDIARYVSAAGGEYEIVLNRQDAIRKAIKEADDTVVMILGKGRETSIKRGGVYCEIPSDVEVAVEAINAL